MKRIRLNAGAVELTIAMLVSGTIGVFVRESHQDVFNIVFYRCLFGAIFLGLSCYLKGYFKDHNLTLPRLGLIALGGALVVADWVLFFKSLSLVSLTLATMVYNIQSFFVVLLGVLVFKETLSKNNIGWIGIAFIGLVFVTKLRLSTLSIHNSYILGIACALGAALFYAIVTIIAKQLKEVHPDLIALIQTIIGVFLLLPFISLEKTPLVGNHWYYLIAIGVLHTGIVYILMYSSYQKLKTPVIAVLNLLYPASGILSDFVIYGYRIDLIQGVGIVLIFLGAVAVILNWSLFPSRSTAKVSTDKALQNRKIK